MSTAQQLHTSILNHLYGIHRAMRQHSEELGTGIHDLTLLQMQALGLVKHHEKIKMSDLAQELHVSPAALSVLINRLVKTEWLERMADPDDRRIVYLRLTTQSAQKFAQLHEQKIKWMRQVFKQLSTAELTAFNQTLSHLTTIISQQSK